MPSRAASHAMLYLNAAPDVNAPPFSAAAVSSLALYAPSPLGIISRTALRNITLTFSLPSMSIRPSCAAAAAASTRAAAQSGSISPSLIPAGSGKYAVTGDCETLVTVV